MTQRSFWRSLFVDVLAWYLTLAVFLIVLAAIYFLVRYMQGVGIWPVALTALAAAALASLLGAAWWRPLTYVGIPVAWLAMTGLFIERAIAFGLGAGLAVGLWLLANVLAAFSLVLRWAVITGQVMRNTLLFYLLFVIWPATGLLFVERGAALDLNRWAVVGSWLLLSMVGLFAYARFLGGVMESQDPQRPAP